MIWTDTGYLLKINNFSENSSVATFLTNSHGLHNGIIYGATSRSKKKYLQLGNKFIINWKSKSEDSLGYYNLGLIQVNNFQHDGFIKDYNKLKEFYKNKIEGIYFNRMDECVEISLCTYFFTLFNIHKRNKHKKLSKPSYIHLCGPSYDSKLKFINNKTLL